MTWSVSPSVWPDVISCHGVLIMSARPDWNAGLLAAQPLPWLPHCQTALVESRGPGGKQLQYYIFHDDISKDSISYY